LVRGTFKPGISVHELISGPVKTAMIDTLFMLTSLDVLQLPRLLETGLGRRVQAEMREPAVAE
jgi:hypothetical protein